MSYSDLHEIQTRLQNFQENSFMFSRSKQIKGTAVSVSVVLGITLVCTFAILCAVNGSPVNIYHNFVHLVLHSNKLHLIIGVSAGLVASAILVTGAANIIRKAYGESEEIFENSPYNYPKIKISIKGNTNTLFCIKNIEGSYGIYYYSDQDAEITGYKNNISEVEPHYMYRYHEFALGAGQRADINEWFSETGHIKFLEKSAYQHHYIVLTFAIVASPFYTIATMAYHIIRTFVIPFWILFHVCREGSEGIKNIYRGKPLILDELKSIPSEMIYSIKKVIMAPFYGLSFSFSAIYALVSPLKGRALLAKVERL